MLSKSIARVLLLTMLMSVASVNAMAAGRYVEGKRVAARLWRNVRHPRLAARERVALDVLDRGGFGLARTSDVTSRSDQGTRVEIDGQAVLVPSSRVLLEHVRSMAELHASRAPVPKAELSSKEHSATAQLDGARVVAETGMGARSARVVSGGTDGLVRGFAARTPVGTEAHTMAVVGTVRVGERDVIIRRVDIRGREPQKKGGSFPLVNEGTSTVEMLTRDGWVPLKTVKTALDERSGAMRLMDSETGHPPAPKTAIPEWMETLELPSSSSAANDRFEESDPQLTRTIIGGD